MKRCMFCMSLIVVISLLLVACTPATSPTKALPTEEPTVTRSSDFALPATERIGIRWFVGVGTGRTPDAVDAAKEFIQEFNDAQEEIALELEVVTK